MFASKSSHIIIETAIFSIDMRIKNTFLLLIATKRNIIAEKMNRTRVPPKNKTSIRMVPIDEECIKILRLLQTEQERANMELGIKNRYRMIFQHFGYIHSVPDIASVNKALSVLLNELDIYPIITTKGARHTYGSYLWHKGFDLGVIAKILGHRDISMLVEVYGHTLEEKIFEEFNQIRDVWKDCS